MAADPKARLEELRARARLEELRAKAASPQPVQSPGQLMATPPAPSGDGTEMGKTLLVPLLGAAKGLTLGYAERGFPESAKQAIKERPGGALLGELLAGLLPGAGAEMAAAKGLRLAAGPLRSAVAGTALGAASDPGETESQVASRAGRAVEGGVLGGVLGGLGKLGRGFGEYRKMGKAGYADEVSGKIGDALESAEQKGFIDRSKEAERLMSEGDIKINLDRLRGISDPLDRFISRRVKPEMIEKTAIGPMGEPVTETVEGMATIGGREANVLRKYLDKLADFRKSKIYADPSAINEPAEVAANVLRSKTQAINPKIPDIQALASANKAKIDALRRATESSPIEGLVSQPLGTRGSILKDIDLMGGSDLSGLAEQIALGRSMSPSLAPQTLYRPIDLALRAGKLGTAAVAHPIERFAPKGTAQSIIQAILDAQKTR